MMGSHSEAPLTLTDNPPRTLGFWAQLAMWASFGVSLFGPLTGALVATTVGSLAGGLWACALGAAIGAALLGGNAAIGAATGAPAMVTMRGLFGRRGSWFPTILNIAQNIGWATMELVVISSAASGVLGAAWRWPFALLAGVCCTIMALRPLGTTTFLRRVLLWLVLACSIYLFIAVLGQPRQPVDSSSALGFWPGVDLAAAQVISFCPLVADYSRHSTGRRAALSGSMLGYGLATCAYYILGVLALVHLGGDLSGTNLITALIALPAGAVAIALLLVDELDQAFANVYSTSVSVHNLAPRVDRRIISVAVGVIATVLAGLLDFAQYENFLFLIGSAFVPLSAVAVVDFFVVRRQRWDLSAMSRLRWSPPLAWLLGFVGYQLIFPGTVPGWSAFFARVAQQVGFVAPTWLGATLGSIVLSGLVAGVAGLIELRLSQKRG
ncbi:MAG: purine-cytosine permease family protein [Propionibacteriaceae bacterium]